MEGQTKLKENQEIANRFNTFFINIGPNQSKNIVYNGDKTHKSYLTHTFQTEFNYTEVNEEIILNIIDNLKNSNSCGFDDLSTNTLKSIKHSVTKPLAIIINQIFNTGEFPEQLKIAKVIPIFKKDDNLQFNNYRPISLLPVLSKVIEKAICNQLTHFIQTNNLFFENQYGFRPGHSTEYAALELTDRIITDMDKNHFPLNIYLDLSKAFDTLNHDILLDKLYYYGIRGTPLKLIKSYLAERHQFVEFRHVKSNMQTLSTGVPQGSILGPLLFLIYINDFPLASRHFNFIMYADDTMLYSTIESPNNDTIERIQTKINTELFKINDWLKINKLSLNLRKSKHMIFKKTNTRNINLTIKIDNLVIERVECFNFLGLTLDSQMTWKKHSDIISNKCSRVIGTLNRIRHFIPTQIIVLLYNTLILPHFNYCIMAWGYQSNRIIKLQKRALRIISKSKYNAHTEPLLKLHKILKIPDILTLQTLKFFYKFNKNELPAYMQNWPLIPSSAIHQHNTRKADNINMFRCHHTFAQKTLRFNIVHTVNNTPQNVFNKFNTHSLHGFSYYVKSTLLESYVDRCNIQNCYICS